MATRAQMLANPRFKALTPEQQAAALDKVDQMNGVQPAATPDEEATPTAPAASRHPFLDEMEPQERMEFQHVLDSMPEEERPHAARALLRSGLRHGRLAADKDGRIHLREKIPAGQEEGLGGQAWRALGGFVGDLREAEGQFARGIGRPAEQGMIRAGVPEKVARPIREYAVEPIAGSVLEGGLAAGATKALQATRLAKLRLLKPFFAGETMTGLKGVGMRTLRAGIEGMGIEPFLGAAERESVGEPTTIQDVGSDLAKGAAWAPGHLILGEPLRQVGPLMSKAYRTARHPFETGRAIQSRLGELRPAREPGMVTEPGEDPILSADRQGAAEKATADQVVDNVMATTPDQPQGKGPNVLERTLTAGEGIENRLFPQPRPPGTLPLDPSRPTFMEGVLGPGTRMDAGGAPLPAAGAEGGRLQRILAEASPEERAQYQYMLEHGRQGGGDFPGVPFELSPDQRAGRVLAGRPEPPPPGFMGEVPPPPGPSPIGPRQPQNVPYPGIPEVGGRNVFTTEPGGDAVPTEVPTWQRGPMSRGGRPEGPTFLDTRREQLSRAEQASRALVPQGERALTVPPTPLTTPGGEFPMTPRRMAAEERARRALQGEGAGPEVTQLGQGFDRDVTSGGRNTLADLQEDLRIKAEARDRATSLPQEDQGDFNVTTGTDMPGVVPPAPSPHPESGGGPDPFEPYNPPPYYNMSTQSGFPRQPPGEPFAGPSSLTSRLFPADPRLPDRGGRMYPAPGGSTPVEPDPFGPREPELYGPPWPPPDEPLGPSGPAGGPPPRPSAPPGGSASHEAIGKLDDEGLIETLSPTAEDEALWDDLMEKGLSDEELGHAVHEATGITPAPEQLPRIRRALALVTERTTLRPDELPFAVRTHDDEVYYDARAMNHSEVVRNHNLDPDDIVDTGFILGGKYKAGNPRFEGDRVVDIEQTATPDWVRQNLATEGKDVPGAGTGITPREKQLEAESRTKAQGEPDLVTRVRAITEGDLTEAKVIERTEWLDELLSDDKVDRLTPEDYERLQGDLADLEGFQRAAQRGELQYDPPKGAPKPEGREKPKALTYDEFAKAYQTAFFEAQRYKPNEVGSRRFTDEMAELADQYPEFLERFEAEDAARPIMSNQQREIVERRMVERYGDEWSAQHVNEEVSRLLELKKEVVPADRQNVQFLIDRTLDLGEMIREGQVTPPAAAKAATDEAAARALRAKGQKLSHETPAERGKREYDEKRTQYEAEAATTPVELLEQVRDDLKANPTLRINEAFLDRHVLASLPYEIHQPASDAMSEIATRMQKELKLRRQDKKLSAWSDLERQFGPGQRIELLDAAIAHAQAPAASTPKRPFRASNEETYRGHRIVVDSDGRAHVYAEDQDGDLITPKLELLPNRDEAVAFVDERAGGAPKESVATPEQKFAPEDHPVSREQLRAQHYVSVKKYSDLHKHGYNIVVWRTAKGATPEQAHWVYEYVPREKNSKLPRLTANADDDAAMKAIEQSVGFDREAPQPGPKADQKRFRAEKAETPRQAIEQMITDLEADPTAGISWLEGNRLERAGVESEHARTVRDELDAASELLGKEWGITRRKDLPEGMRSFSNIDDQIGDGEGAQSKRLLILRRALQQVEEGEAPPVTPAAVETKEPAAPGPVRLTRDDPLVTMPKGVRSLFARLAERLKPEDIEGPDVVGSGVFDIGGGKDWPAKMEKAGYWDRDRDRVTPKFQEDFRRWFEHREQPVEYVFDPSTAQKTPIRYEGVEDTRPGKRAFGAVRQMASDDVTRLNLAGVYVDPKGYIAATNGHYLVLAPGKPRGLEAGKIYDDAGKVIDAEFPDWRQVVPDPKNRQVVGKITAAELEALAKTPKVMDPTGPKGRTTRYVVVQTPHGEMYLDADLLQRVGGTMRQLGVEELNVEWLKKTKGVDPATSPIIFTEANPPRGGEPVLAIQMPMRADGTAANRVTWTPGEETPVATSTRKPPKQGGGSGGAPPPAAPAAAATERGPAFVLERAAMIMGNERLTKGKVANAITRIEKLSRMREGEANRDAHQEAIGILQRFQKLADEGTLLYEDAAADRSLEWRRMQAQAAKAGPVEKATAFTETFDLVKHTKVGSTEHGRRPGDKMAWRGKGEWDGWELETIPRSKADPSYRSFMMPANQRISGFSRRQSAEEGLDMGQPSNWFVDVQVKKMPEGGDPAKLETFIQSVEPRDVLVRMPGETLAASRERMGEPTSSTPVRKTAEDVADINKGLMGNDPDARIKPAKGEAPTADELTKLQERVNAITEGRTSENVVRRYVEQLQRVADDITGGKFKKQEEKFKRGYGGKPPELKDVMRDIRTLARFADEVQAGRLKWGEAVTAPAPKATTEDELVRIERERREVVTRGLYDLREHLKDNDTSIQEAWKATTQQEKDMPWSFHRGVLDALNDAAKFAGKRYGIKEVGKGEQRVFAFDKVMSREQRVELLDQAVAIAGNREGLDTGKKELLSDEEWADFQRRHPEPTDEQLRQAKRSLREALSGETADESSSSTRRVRLTRSEYIQQMHDRVSKKGMTLEDAWMDVSHQLGSSDQTPQLVARWLNTGAKAELRRTGAKVESGAAPWAAFDAKASPAERQKLLQEALKNAPPTPDEVLAQHPGAKKSGRLYDSTTPGDYPEGVAEQQAKYVSAALDQAAENRRRAEEAGDDATARREEAVADTIKGGFREGTKTAREELEKRGFKPTQGVGEPAKGSGLVRAYMQSAADRFRNHPAYRRVVDTVKHAIDSGTRLQRAFVSRPGEVRMGPRGRVHTGGWDAVWNTVQRDKDKAQYGLLEKAVAKSEADDVFHTNEDLKAMGLNDDTIAGYRQLHHLFRIALEQVINPLRKRLGLPSISGIKGFYFPHKWMGVYEIHDKGGARIETPLGRASFATLREARLAAREHLRAEPSAELEISMRKPDVPDDVTEAGESAAIRKIFEAAGSDKEVLGAVEAVLAKDRTARGFIRHLEHRKGASGYETGKLAEVGRQYFNQLSNYAPRKLAHERITAILREVDETRDPQLHEDMEAFLQAFNGKEGMVERAISKALVNNRWFGHFLDPRRAGRAALGGARELTAHAKIGMLNPAFFVMNLTQPLTHTMPITGGRSFSAGVRAMLAPTAEELAVVRMAKKAGLLVPRFTDIPVPAGTTRGRHAWDQAKQISFALGQASEYMNRRVTILAAHDRLQRAFAEGGRGTRDRIMRFAYDRAKDPRVQVGEQWQKFNPKDRRHVIDFLRRVNDRTQFRYDVTDRARFMRSAVGLTAAQFKSYVTATMGMQGRFLDLAKEGELSPLVYHLGAGLALAGIATIPGRDAISSLIAKITGIDPMEEFNKFVWKQEAKGGARGALASVAKGGLPALAGLDVTRRIGQADFIPSRWRDFAPPVANMAYGMFDTFLNNGFRDALNGQLPTARWFEQVSQHMRGVMKDRYGRVLYTEPAWTDIKDLKGALQAAGVAAGLPTTRSTRTYEQKQAAEHMKQTQIQKKRDLYGAFVEAEKANNPQRMRELAVEGKAAGVDMSRTAITKWRKERERPASERMIRETPKVIRPQVYQWLPKTEADKARRALESGGKK